MPAFSIYDRTSGLITRHGICQENTLNLQVFSSTEGLLVGDYPPESYYVVDGVPFAYTEDELTRLHNKPSIGAKWSIAIMNWVETQSSAQKLADLKRTKTREINAARLKANRDTFTFMGKQISCDELSRSDIDGVNGIVLLLGAMPPDWVGFWKTADNSYVAIPDVATWIEFYSAMVAQGQENFAHSQNLKVLLDITATSEEVDAINW